MTLPVGYVLVAVGGLLVAVGNVSNRYHSRRFDAHTDRLARLSEAREPEAIGEEIRAFSEDRRVNVAIELLIVEPIGVVVLIMGLGVLLL